MHPTDHAHKATATPSQDGFFPSARFAKVPAEALDALAYEGPHKLSHAEFRLFVALCRFRGIARIVNPSQETLASMTGISRSNVSRTAHLLQAKGWARIHHADGDPQKRVSNYELLIPVRGVSPGVEPEPRKERASKPRLEAAPECALASEASADDADTLDERSRIERDELTPPDYPDFDSIDDDSLTDDEVSEHLSQCDPGDHGAATSSPINIEPMTEDELDALVAQMEFAEA